MLGGMIKNAAGAAVKVVSGSLSIDHSYSAAEAAAFLGITVFVLNQRVRQGFITPIFSTGDRRYSGYTLAKLLGWPLSDNPQDYMPGRDPVRAGRVRRRRARVVR